jgi:geranylgeranyl reductase family protein
MVATGSASAADSFDVAVVGSGPAGACSARLLARAGLRTIILEKCEVPRYKTCGGGVVARGLALLGLSSIPVAQRLCHAAEFVLADELSFRVERPYPVVYMTMRDEFDAWLTQLARDAGAELRTQCAVEDVTISPERVCLHTSSGDVLARYVVAADGASGPLAKKAGFPERRRVAAALELEVRVPAADFDRLSETARFDFPPVPGGYAWSFPKRSHLSMGVGLLNRGAAVVNLNQCFDRYLADLGIGKHEVIARHGFVIPTAPRDKILARGRICLVGDSAGLADPISAEGITPALQSATLAARAIIAGFPDPAAIAGEYHAALAREVLPELFLGRQLARLLFDFPRLRNRLFRWRGQMLAEAMTHVIAGKATYKSLLASFENYATLIQPPREYQTVN